MTLQLGRRFSFSSRAAKLETPTLQLSCFLLLFLVCCFFLIYTFRFCLQLFSQKLTDRSARIPMTCYFVFLSPSLLLLSLFCCLFVCLFVRLGWICLTAIQSQTDRNVFSLLRIMRNSIPNGVHGSTAEQLQRYRFYLMAGQFQLCWPFRRQMQWRRPVFPFFSRNQQSKRLFLKKKDGGGCGVVVCSILTLLETAKKNWSLFRVR